MSIVERLYAPISERPSPDAAIDAFDNKDNAIALRRRAAGSSFFRAMQLLPARRREAMRALCAFWREVDGIADGEASRSLKQTLLLNWRSEIAHLFAGRPSERSALHAAAWTLGAIVPWATMAAVIDAALKTVPSSQLLFWSFVFATPAAFLWDRLLGGRPAIALFRISLPVLLIGLLGIFGWTAGVQLSLDRAPVIEANLLTYLWPLMMVAMSPLAGERFSAVSLFGVVAGFVGAALIATGGKGVAIEPGFYVGYSLALAGALAWAVFVILLQRQGSHATRRTPVFVAAGCVCAFAMAFGIDGRISIPPPMAILEAAWLGIGPMSLAFVCWDRAVTTNHLALVGRLSYLDPLISTLLLMIFMGLLPTPAAWIGMILIILGVALPEIWTFWSRRAPPR